MSARWKIALDRIETLARVGIHPHEREPQRLLVDVEIEAEYAGKPQKLEECFNYELVYDRVVKEWPKRAQTDLLETLVLDLLAHIFKSDARVVSAQVSVGKPDIFESAEKVSVALKMTRAEFLSL